MIHHQSSLNQINKKMVSWLYSIMRNGCGWLDQGSNLVFNLRIVRFHINISESSFSNFRAIIINHSNLVICKGQSQYPIPSLLHCTQNWFFNQFSINNQSAIIFSRRRPAVGLPICMLSHPARSTVALSLLTMHLLLYILDSLIDDRQQWKYRFPFPCSALYSFCWHHCYGLCITSQVVVNPTVFTNKT